MTRAGLLGRPLAQASRNVAGRAGAGAEV